MDKDTGVNSEFEHADTRCAGQENQRNIEEREQAGALVATRCTSIVNCKSPLLANSSSNKH